MAITLSCVGCTSTNTDSTKFNAMCNRQPDSIVCNVPDTNTIYPSFEYLNRIANELTYNTIYKEDTNDYWEHNNLTNELLIGDCEDIAFTFVSQLLLDGVRPETIYIVFSKHDKLSHIHVEINTIEGIYKFNIDTNLKEFKRLTILELNN